MGKIIAIFVVVFSAISAPGLNSSAREPGSFRLTKELKTEPIVGPDWTRAFIQKHYHIQFLAFGLTDAMQILVNETPFGGVSNLLYDIYDKSSPTEIRLAANVCLTLHNTWEQIVCAHKAAEKIGYANPNFDVKGLCRVLALAFRSVMNEINNPNVFVGQIGIIARDQSGNIWGHNLDRITVRSVTGMTYAYAVDDESGNGPIVIYPLSLSAKQFKKRYGSLLPHLSNF